MNVVLFSFFFFQIKQSNIITSSNVSKTLDSLFLCDYIFLRETNGLTKMTLIFNQPLIKQSDISGFVLNHSTSTKENNDISPDEIPLIASLYYINDQPSHVYIYNTKPIASNTIPKLSMEIYSFKHMLKRHLGITNIHIKNTILFQAIHESQINLTMEQIYISPKEKIVFFIWKKNIIIQYPIYFTSHDIYRASIRKSFIVYFWCGVFAIIAFLINFYYIFKTYIIKEAQENIY